MADWMYEQLTESEYVLDPRTASSCRNPTRGPCTAWPSDLLEAAGRGMWAEPSADTIAGLRQVLFETEGDLEGDPTPANVRVCTAHAVPTRTKRTLAAVRLPSDRYRQHGPDLR